MSASTALEGDEVSRFANPLKPISSITSTKAGNWMPLPHIAPALQMNPADSISAPASGFPVIPGPLRWSNFPRRNKSYRGRTHALHDQHVVFRGNGVFQPTTQIPALPASEASPIQQAADIVRFCCRRDGPFPEERQQA